jgi:hypothetical protein
MRLFRCLEENLGFKQPIFTYLGSLEKSWPIDGSKRMFDHGLGLWPAPDPKKQVKIKKMKLSFPFNLRAYYSIFNLSCYVFDLI